MLALINLVSSIDIVNPSNDDKMVISDYGCCFLIV